MVPVSMQQIWKMHVMTHVGAMLTEQFGIQNNRLAQVLVGVNTACWIDRSCEPHPCSKVTSPEKNSTWLQQVVSPFGNSEVQKLRIKPHLTSLTHVLSKSNIFCKHLMLNCDFIDCLCFSMYQTLWYWSQSYPLGLRVYFCRFHRSGWFSFLLVVSVACFTFHILPSFSVNCRRMLCCDVFIEFAAFFLSCVCGSKGPQKSSVKPHPNSSKMDLTNIPGILQAGRVYVLVCLECIITKSSHTPLSNRGAGWRGTKNANTALWALTRRIRHFLPKIMRNKRICAHFGPKLQCSRFWRFLDGSSTVLDGPRRFLDGSSTVLDGPRRSSTAPRRCLDGSSAVPRRSSTVPRRLGVIRHENNFFGAQSGK